MQRRAFTLMELLLVLALIVVIGALVTPYIGRSFQNQKLRYAADQLRADFLKARNQALKSGRIHMFRYEPETGRYRVEAWVAENDALEAAQPADGAASPPPTAQTGAAAPGDGSAVNVRELPGEATFVDSQVFSDTRGAQVENEVPEEASASGSGWSRPILFYPDGSSSAARVVITNESYFILINLRGLTGSTVASDLLTLEEVTNAAQP